MECPADEEQEAEEEEFDELLVGPPPPELEEELNAGEQRQPCYRGPHPLACTGQLL
jgi:hypothetical protein